jgi:hypothetical protein
MTIMIREGKIGANPWRQYMVISDERVVIIDMLPMLHGWNFGKCTVQCSEDWPNMKEAKIVDWKHRNDDLAKVVSLPADVTARICQIASESTR